MRLLSNEEKQKKLLEKANSLPLTPGVYLMKDASGRIIYVGKSRKLKNRVSQYFQNSVKQIKTARMVAAVADFDYFLCSTEIEALALENTLIKQHTPKYNIRLKDAKSYPYIKITAEPYPRLEFTRTRKADKGRYFGPYSGASVAGGVLRTLQRILCLPTCTRRFPKDIGKERPCLYYQLGQCCGVCTGKVSEAEYAELIRCAAEILRGETAAARARVRREMEQAAEEERFERAAVLRDRLFALEKLSQKQKVLAAPDVSEDVFGLYRDAYGTAMSVFYIREGALIDKYETVFGAEEILEEEALLTFIYDHYRYREDVPPRILLSFEAPEEDVSALADSLTAAAGHKVQIYTPQRGDRHTRCILAVENAKEKLQAERNASEKSNENLVRLAHLLALEALPERIESYDISNLGSEHKTCGMIVFENGKFKKSDYRTFRIKSVEGTDDYASMREAMSRRFAHLGEDKFGREPDLILLDGGATHVATVRRLMEELRLDIPVFGMVKDAFHKTRALCSEREEISIAGDRGVFTMIYRIQEEVHRFSVKRMSEAKSGTLRSSGLEKIPGVGKAKAKLLLAHFKGLSGVREADEKTLAEVAGIGPVLAGEIYRYFHKKEEGAP
ncbi:MAG: excinuclease ABC subunit UvrC [Ruminococcaceae bacterium]|nr:excinuclease ABC subunit UvrC [Oscillospiraceae bacterium]